MKCPANVNDKVDFPAPQKPTIMILFTGLLMSRSYFSDLWVDIADYPWGFLLHPVFWVID